MVYVFPNQRDLVMIDSTYTPTKSDRHDLPPQHQYDTITGRNLEIPDSLYTDISNRNSPFSFNDIASGEIYEGHPPKPSLEDPRVSSPSENLEVITYRDPVTIPAHVL